MAEGSAGVVTVVMAAVTVVMAAVTVREVRTLMEMAVVEMVGAAMAETAGTETAAVTAVFWVAVVRGTVGL